MGTWKVMRKNSKVETQLHDYKLMGGASNNASGTTIPVQKFCKNIPPSPVSIILYCLLDYIAFWGDLAKKNGTDHRPVIQ